MPALSTGTTINSTTIYDESWVIVDTAGATVSNVFTGFQLTPPAIVPKQEGKKIYFNHDQNKLNSYWFHPDHLGSSSYITNEAGIATQHMEYLPFGETLVDEHTNSFNSPFKYNGKEFDEETGNYYYSARYYDPKWSIFISVDPLAEIQPDKTPYHYCSNNPINRIDPTGLTDFTLNKKTGEVKQVGEKNNDPDRILKTNGKGEVKYMKNGEAKVAVGGIEPGILQDGQNFKDNDHVINVGGEGQPTVKGVEDFSLKLSEYVGKEIGGAYFTKEGSVATTHMTIGKYKNNNLQLTKGHGHVEGLRQGLKLNEITGFYHTHPSIGYSVSDRTRASEADLKARDHSLNMMPGMRFYIITAPLNYGSENEKIDYTNH